jgi:hypothetical protein
LLSNTIWTEPDQFVDVNISLLAARPRRGAKENTGEDASPVPDLMRQFKIDDGGSPSLFQNAPRMIALTNTNTAHTATALSLKLRSTSQPPRS